MTLNEFNQYNETKSMPREWIGQGCGYKAEKWDSDDDIIYIPENGYEETDDCESLTGEVLRQNAYSMNDLIELVKERHDMPTEKAKEIATSLFDSVDWQFPDSVMDEEWFEYYGLFNSYKITITQLEEMIAFAQRNPRTEFSTEAMNDGEEFLSCTFFKENGNDNASGFWELEVC